MVTGPPDEPRLRAVDQGSRQRRGQLTCEVVDPLGPVEAGTGERSPPRAGRVDVDSPPDEPAAAGIGEPVASWLRHEPATPHQAVVEDDATATRDVVVAGAGLG